MANEVISFEVDPAAADMLRERFGRDRRVAVVARVVGAHTGAQTLHRFSDGCPFNTLSEKWVYALGQNSDAERSRPHIVEENTATVEFTMLDVLVRQHGKPDYIKNDIDVYELEVIKGLPSVDSILSFECNLPAFASETTSAIETIADHAPNGCVIFTVTESPAQFTSPHWVARDKIVEIVDSGELEFMEIYFDPRRAAGVFTC